MTKIGTAPLATGAAPPLQVKCSPLDLRLFMECQQSQDDIIMSERLNQCCNRLKDEIRTVEICLTDVAGHLSTAAEEKVEGMEARLKSALAKCEAQREHASTAGQGVRQFLEQKKAEVISKYEDWKTDREIEKLEKHADKLEDQAVDAVVVAAYALLEAEVAIVEALKARKIAVEVAG